MNISSSFSYLNINQTTQKKISNSKRTNTPNDILLLSFKGINKTDSPTSDFFLRLKVQKNASTILKSAEQILKESANEYENARRNIDIATKDIEEQNMWYLQEDISSIQTSEETRGTVVNYNDGRKDVIIQDENGYISCIVKSASLGNDKVFIYKNGVLSETFKTANGIACNYDFGMKTEEQYHFTDGQLSSYTPQRNPYGIYPIIHELYCFNQGSLCAYLEDIQNFDKKNQANKTLIF